jgi:N-acetylglucosamine kinase-like BadF-type ATPase
MVASPSKPLRLVVGIDGGGTSTKCVVSSVPVSSSAVIVGVGEGGSANANSVGFDAALENVAGAIVAALRDAPR